MARRTTWQAIAAAGLHLLALGGCAEPAAGPAPARPSEKDIAPLTIGEPRALTLDEPALRQPLSGAGERIGEANFIETELAAIDNPDLVPLVFELHFEDADGKETFLGTFGPFPPDNPGTFLVGIDKRLSPEGTLILTMRRAQSNGPEAGDVRVEVAPFRLRGR